MYAFQFTKASHSSHGQGQNEKGDISVKCHFLHCEKNDSTYLLYITVCIYITCNDIQFAIPPDSEPF